MKVLNVFSVGVKSFCELKMKNEMKMKMKNEMKMKKAILNK